MPGRGSYRSPAARRPACSNDPHEQGAGIADIVGRLAALDRGQDRLQQRPAITIRPCVVPKPGEVGCGAQFEQASFLAMGDLDRFYETGLRAQPIRFWTSERDMPTEP